MLQPQYEKFRNLFKYIFWGVTLIYLKSIFSKMLTNKQNSLRNSSKLRLCLASKTDWRHRLIFLCFGMFILLKFNICRVTRCDLLMLDVGSILGVDLECACRWPCSQGPLLDCG